MFDINEKNELNQISLTGIRALVLIGMLIKAPRSLDEIRSAFIELNIHDKNNSDDILRIDLNTLKLMGCEISRASQKTNYKYVLSNHPFSLKINNEELAAIKKIYKHLQNQSSIARLIEYDELLNKIANQVCDQKTKENILGISIFKRYNIQNIKELLADCKFNRILNLEYKKPTSNKTYKKEITAQKLVYKNDNILLYCKDNEKNEPSILNFSRIVSIFSRRKNKNDLEIKTTKIKFEIDNTETDLLEENEKIVGSSETKCIIEAEYHNDFVATQRILSLGTKCKVIEPIDFRNSIVAKLREMSANYAKN